MLNVKFAIYKSKNIFIVVLGVWMHLNNIEVSTVKAQAIVVS